MLMSHRFVSVAALAFTGVAAVAQDLDAALEAQKQKAQRRVYSERAVLDNQAPTVPQPKSAEELAIDQKLREMDAQAEAGSRTSPELMMPRAAASAVPLRPAENKNWLTPAALDNSAAASLPSDEDSWLTKEAERQKAQKEKSAQAKDQEMVDKLVREKMQQQNTAPDAGVLKPYTLTPQAPGPLPAPSFSLPGNSPAQSSLQPSRKPAPVTTAPLFSPQSRSSSALNQDPLQQSRGSTSGSPFSRPASGFSSGLDTAPESPALSPLQKIKKSSPINQANPFADDHMPQFKSSIWE